MAGYTLRPVTAEDRAFVQDVYLVTQRWLIERLFGWHGDEEERGNFWNFFRAENSSVIVVDGTDAGWMTVDRTPGKIVLESIYLAPERQRKGIGSEVIRDLIAEATAAGATLSLSTARINPARWLYERLGFAVVSEDRLKVSMVYRTVSGAALN